MQANTAVVENQPVNFPDFSYENRTSKSGRYTKRDGRYVGGDGFLVPMNFNEFFQRFPDYVSRWVSKHADRRAPEEDLEDWTQDLLLHLCYLPQTSKYRETGRKDIVETFDPMRHYGANEARFRNYVNLCLANKFRTMYSKRMKDALCHSGNVSFDEQTECEDRLLDEFCYEHSAQLRAVTKACGKQSADRAFLQEFVNFVRREDPKVLPTMDALLMTGTQGEAAEWLGNTKSEFGRSCTRLRQLAGCFLSGDPVPKQRKPYMKRAFNHPKVVVPSMLGNKR